MREEKMTFLELLIGIILFSALISVVGVILTEDKLAFFLGVVFGAAAAVVLCFHMYKTLEVTLDLDEEGAKKRARAMTGVRMLIMGATVFAALKLSGIFNIIGVILGILTLKFAAFFQPLLHKGITSKIFDKGR